jgi:hypothetical protein
MLEKIPSESFLYYKWLVARSRGLALTRRVAYKDAALSCVSAPSSFLISFVRIAESNHLHPAVTAGQVGLCSIRVQSKDIIP